MQRFFLGLIALIMSIGIGSIPAHAEETTPAGGSCSFYCVPVDEGGQPRGEPVQAMVVVSCNPQQDRCAEACEARCQNNGTTDPDSQQRPTNGLPTRHGRMRCFRPEGATATRRPYCVATQAGSQRSGGGLNQSDTPSSNRQGGSQGEVELLNPLGRGVTSIPQLFGRIVRAFMGILGALAMFWFVWGGILWMTAEESKRSEQAQTILKNAALGLILIFFAYGLTTMFLSLFQEVASNAVPSRQTVTPPPPRTQ